MENSIKIKDLGSSDYVSYLEVLITLKKLNLNSQVEATGFNNKSGYVWAYLENGLTVCSCFGRDVEFLVTDFESGEEYFFDNYNEAINKLNDLQNED